MAPNTEMINLASEGLMQQSLGILTGSGAPKVDSGDSID